jgi:hypothetical protein
MRGENGSELVSVRVIAGNRSERLLWMAIHRRRKQSIERPLTGGPLMRFFPRGISIIVPIRTPIPADYGGGKDRESSRRTWF